MDQTHQIDLFALCRLLGSITVLNRPENAQSAVTPFDSILVDCVKVKMRCCAIR